MPDDLTLLYPYDKDAERHPLAWVFFHAAGLQADLDVCDALAKHVFDKLGCSGPGSASEPTVKYDALGTSGAPYEPGAWIAREKPRLQVATTMPEKSVTHMDDEEFVEAQHAIIAEAAARRARAADSSDPYHKKPEKSNGR